MRRRDCLRLESDLRLWLTFEAFEQAGGRMLTLHDFRREDDPPPPVNDDNVAATPAGVWGRIRLWKLSRDGEALTYLAVDNGDDLAAQTSQALGAARTLYGTLR